MTAAEAFEAAIIATEECIGCLKPAAEHRCLHIHNPKHDDPGTYCEGCRLVVRLRDTAKLARRHYHQLSTAEKAAYRDKEERCADMLINNVEPLKLVTPHERALLLAGLHHVFNFLGI